MDVSLPVQNQRADISIDRSMVCAAGVAALLVLPLMYTVGDPLSPALAAQALAYVVLAVSSVVLSVIDVRVHRLPNLLVGATASAGFVFFALAALLEGEAGALVRAMTAALAVGAVFMGLAMIRAGALGGGDIKLAATLALFTGWLSWEAVLVGVASGFLFGGFGALWVVIRRRADAATRIAFGPYLFAGAWLAIALALPMA